MQKKQKNNLVKSKKENYFKRKQKKINYTIIDLQPLLQLLWKNQTSKPFALGY